MSAQVERNRLINTRKGRVSLFGTLREDIRTVFAKDPAARNWLEVLCCYPGIHAIWAHRIAHILWTHKFCLLARMLSQFSRFFTGIEIHPDAKIGRRLFIDHGMGVVIGETAEIGDDVLLYQGIVLGGTTLEKAKRHPTLENGVVVGSAAILLGAITIGEGALVGANSVVVKSVPPGVTIVGVPGHIVGQQKRIAQDLEHGKLPDPIAEALRLVNKKQAVLDARISSLEKGKDNPVVSSILHEQISTEETFKDGNDVEDLYT
jgi:serine O-acetyltransferase